MQTCFQSGRTRRNLVLCFSWALLIGGHAARGAAPHWISGASEDGKSQRLSKTFSIEESVRGAELKLAADFCTAIVTLNVPDHPDNGLPTIDVGRGSPTAVIFGTNLDFHAPYSEAMFALDWAYGRVLAVHLAPRGAGYRASLELFMQGKPLNVTDVATGPDGAMWLITGGRKTRSALYRVTRATMSAPAPSPGRHEQEVLEFSARKRELRLLLLASSCRCHTASRARQE